MRGYCMHFIEDAAILEMILDTSLSVHGNRPFLVCLFLDLDLMAAIVSGIVGHF